MSTSELCLKKGDRVVISRNGKPGTISRTPRGEDAQRIGVIPDGAKSAQYFYVADLRPESPGELAPEAGVFPPRRGQPSQFEARAELIKPPARPADDGTHLKSYLVSYVTERGECKLEKMAANGIIPAITLFYGQFEEVAIISVVCVL